jgi:hypothetical protein
MTPPSSLLKIDAGPRERTAYGQRSDIESRHLLGHDTDSDEAGEYSDGEEHGEDGVIDNDLEPLGANVFGFALASLLRDAVNMAKGTGHLELRLLRLVSGLILAFLTIWLQLILLYFMAKLLCAKAVVSIRDDYGTYERTMYPNHTVLTVNGHHRGISGYLVPANFQLLDEETRDSVCEIPLAHPRYIVMVLLVWSLTCMQHIRLCYEESWRLLWNTPWGRSLKDGCKEGHEVESEERQKEPLSLEVHRLPLRMKISICVLILVPRVITLLLLMYGGCRWLLATADLGEVFLNAVALEFVINLPDLMHNVLKAVLNTFIKPFRPKESVSIVTFFDTYLWGIAALAWVLLYVFYLQTVLPDYMWDVRDICEQNMATPRF